jgi:hypothetical protein
VTVQELIDELSRYDRGFAVLMQVGTGERGFLAEVEGVEVLKSDDGFDVVLR